MRIAIVIPVFNDGADLRQALCSVKDQTRPADELIIVDDHSTDWSTKAELADLERRPPIPATRLLRLEDNRGAAEARMIGIEQATADAILPLDADDILLPRALLLLERALHADSGAAFASGHVRYFGALRGEVTVPRFNPYVELDENPQLNVALFRAELFRERGFRYPPLASFEDWGLWLALAEKGVRGAQVEEPVFCYRRKQGGLSAWGDTRRPELEAKLRSFFPALYSPEGRARLKQRHAPALEVVWDGAADDSSLAAFLAAQTLPDVTVTAGTFRTARALLAASRGKVLLQLSPMQLALLERSRPSFLEQVLRCAEGHPESAAVVVPLDEATLRSHCSQPRLIAFNPARFVSHPLDLFFLRTLRAAELREGHLAPEAPPRELVAPFLRRGRMLLFAEDFARLVKAPLEDALPEQRMVSPAPGETVWKRSLQSARPLWRRARRAAERVVGEKQLGRVLHPWKLRAHDWFLAADAAESALRQGRIPLSLAPLLSPSVRAEKQRLDLLPTQWQPLARVSRGKRRALLVTPWVVQGGADRAVLDMAAALAADGWELFAATHMIANHDWEQRLLKHVRDLHLLGETTSPQQQPQALVEIARRLDPDVLFMVNSWLALESLESLREALPRLRTVDYQHTDYQAPGADYARVSCLRHDQHLDLRAVSTEYLMGRYRAYGIKPDKVRVIRAGCDEMGDFDPVRVQRGQVRARLGLPENTPLLGFVGRFVPEKDPLFVVRTFAAVDEAARAKGSAPLHLAMVGEGPLRVQAQDLAVSLQLSARVHFFPANIQVPSLLRDLDLLMLASRIEGLPLVFFEALALETPVVTTAIEGIPELIDGEVGACVPDLPDPDDRLRALVAAALPLVMDSPRRKAAGQAGRRRIAERFPAAASRAAWVALFRELAELEQVKGSVAERSSPRS